MTFRCQIAVIVCNNGNWLVKQHQQLLERALYLLIMNFQWEEIANTCSQ